MATDKKPQQHQFQTEVDQLLNLVIHSLYGHSEIFLRELISNASDANDKLRFKALSNDKLYEGNQDQKITIHIEPTTQTLTISDHGIGMNEKEIIENIGTIANSGTKKFLEKLTKEKTDANNLIGQFGVGFYSSFIVAEKVTLVTRKAGSKKAFKWISSGKKGFTLEPCEKTEKGTDVILKLKKEAEEYLDPYKLRAIVKKYSNHIHFPIQMQQVDSEAAQDESKKENGPTLKNDYEQVNDTQALWSKPKKDLKPEQYHDFYKQTFFDYQNPQDWIHNQVEGTIEYTSLFFIPSNPPFDLWDPKRKQGIKLFIKRVFIMDHQDILPNYLRFIRGLIDSTDLPLNISREILQENQTIKKIKSGSVTRILKYLQDLSKDENKYQTFWQNFGQVLKEGIVEDLQNKNDIAKLLRFAHTQDEKMISLDEYIKNMKETQKQIFFIISDSASAAKNSPHLEIFNEKNIDVLIMSDPVDEWVTSHLNEYEGKTIQSVGKEGIHLDELETQQNNTEKNQKDTQTKTEDTKKDEQIMIDIFKKHLGDQIEDVRISKRLTQSPSCLVSNQQDLSMSMEKMLKSMGQQAPASKPILEINPIHKLIKNIPNLEENEQKTWIEIIYKQAELSIKGQVKDPANFVKQLNQLLEKIHVR